MADELPTPRVERDALGVVWFTNSDGEQWMVGGIGHADYDRPTRQPMTLICVPVDGA